jgi:hypothetical protein
MHYGNQILQCLPQFVDEMFLHDHPERLEKALFSAAVQSFGITGVLDHTSILLTFRGVKGQVVTHELALSTPYLPWGLRLPSCLNCLTNLWVKCKAGQGPKSDSEKSITIWCERCKQQGTATKASNVKVLPKYDAPTVSIVRLEHPNVDLAVEWEQAVSSGKKKQGGVLNLEALKKAERKSKV